VEAGDTEYPSWSEAAASGDSSWEAAVEKVRAAVIKLLQGSHEYERDGIAFGHRPAAYKLRDIIRSVWKPGDTIIDFGGGLGGTYLNNADIFEASVLTYLVIEQDIFCEEGTRLAKKFKLPLTYSSSFAEVHLQNPPRLLIFSGVLNYLQHWSSTVEQSLALQPEHIVVDRTAITPATARFFSVDYSDHYGSQIHVPYQTINENCLVSAFPGYRVVDEWKSEFDPEANVKGYHFVRSRSATVVQNHH